MMEQCQGVTVLSAHVEANPDNFPGDLERLNQEMAQIKRRLRRPQPLSSYAVVEQDGFDGSPVTHLEICGEASTKLSELRYEKRRDSLFNGVKTQPGRYALEMEDLAEQKGENSYIAVIHIDGNNMGELVQKLMDQNPTYETAVPAMRQLSAGIAQRNRQASEAMETAFASVFDREPLPLRPLIMDGDDMTFLCCCKAGIGGRGCLSAKAASALGSEVAALGLRRHRICPQSFPLQRRLRCCGGVLFQGEKPLVPGERRQNGIPGFSGGSGCICKGSQGRSAAGNT